MSTTIKQDTSHWVGIDTEFDAFNEAANFSIEIRNAITGDEVANTGTGVFHELMWNFTPYTGTVAAAALAEEPYIVLTDATGLTIGDRFQIVDEVYYITAIDTNNVYVKGGVKADIAELAEVNSVGNTGLYRVDVKLPLLGTYFVNLRHPVMGHTSHKVEVVANTVDDVYNRLDSGLNTLGANRTFKVIA